MLTKKDPKRITARCGKKKLTEADLKQNSRQMKTQQTQTEINQTKYPYKQAIGVEQQIQTN